jgi:hypothetical protein
MKCDCSPDTMGTYTHHISVIDQDGKTVSVDACMVPELASLWRQGIRTTGSCCGHKGVSSFVAGKTDADAAALDRIGYTRHPDAPHCHVAKTKTVKPAIESLPETIEVPYPFVMDAYNGVDEEGQGFSTESWRPGTKPVTVSVDEIFGDISQYIAQGMGHMLIRVVKVVRLPKHYKTRVFYVRQWRDPDGKVFGKTALKVATADAFKRLLNGFRYSYRLVE